MTENYLLEVKNVSKSFGVVKALNRIDFNVRPNEIHALCGENGAGKSTLMNILSGVYPYGSYGGEVYYDGELCKFRNVRESEKKNIAIIHQHLALFPALSIAENMDCVLHDKTPQAGDAFETTFNNGVCDVTAFLIAPEVIDKDNYQAALFDSGYYSEDQLK